MLANIDAVLIISALVCFVASSFGVAARVNLQSAGLALWVLTSLV